MPSAPGMLCTTICGLPGRYLARYCAIMRPEVSVPPPGGGPMIMVTVLPSSVNGACAKAVAQNASIAASVTIERRMFPPSQARGLLCRPAQAFRSVADSLLLHHGPDVGESFRRRVG